MADVKTETPLKGMIADVVSEHADRPDDADPNRWGWCADRILAIPAIKEALAFHESCQKAFAVTGEFTVTKDNLPGRPSWR